MTPSADLLDFKEWAVLRVAGPDAREFLQGTATQDVAGLAPGAALPSLFLTDKGRPVGLAWLVMDASGEAALLFAEPGSRDRIPRHLERMRVMEDVTVSGPNGMPRLYAVVGPDRDATARRWAEALAGAEVIAADPMTFLLLPPGAERPGSVARVLAALTLPDVAEAWRIGAGIPKAGVDFDEARIATELSLEEAISLTKGCYVGQEVVARTTHRGAARRRRIGFRYDGSAGFLAHGTELISGGSVVAGFVTSTTLEPGTGRGLGMGYLSTDALETPGEVRAIRDAVNTHIEVTPWPL
ncbi:MAG TPA: glycine cleavage T C-terminal barrel domain-containing protein [Acidobacteriota bacterium]|nr:glycine cleavage T C-terminal barrel domain-containing protein [Acidobacteriota bacterium]